MRTSLSLCEKSHSTDSSAAHDAVECGMTHLSATTQIPRLSSPVLILFTANELKSGFAQRLAPMPPRPQPVYAPENKPRAASTLAASSMRTRQNVHGKARDTIMFYYLTCQDKSNNARAARIYAGMIIRER
jgi:hypothetical protein